MRLVFHKDRPTPWREVRRQEVFREAQYLANRHRCRVTVYHRPMPDHERDGWYFRVPGEKAPVFAQRVTWFDSEL